MTYRDKLEKLQLDLLKRYDFYSEAGVEVRQGINSGLFGIDLLKQKKDKLFADFQRSFNMHRLLQMYVTDNSVCLDSQVALWVMF
jgi:hypothetical protein